MKKHYFFIVTATILFVGFMCVIIYAFVEANNARGRYAISSPKTATSGGGHHSGSSDSVPTNIEDMRDKKEITMDISNNLYQYSNIEITKGTTVTWVNRDNVEHNVMQDHTNSGAAHDATTADNVKESKFSGPSQKVGETYSFTFNEAGQIDYHCAKHPEMRGKITVVES